MVFAAVVLGVLLLPFRIDEFAVDVTAGLGLARVDGLLSLRALIFCLSLDCHWID